MGNELGSTPKALQREEGKCRGSPVWTECFLPMVFIPIPVHPVACLPSVCLCWARSHWQELAEWCPVPFFPLLLEGIRSNTGFSHTSHLPLISREIWAPYENVVFHVKPSLIASVFCLSSRLMWIVTTRSRAESGTEWSLGAPMAYLKLLQEARAQQERDADHLIYSWWTLLGFSLEILLKPSLKARKDIKLCFLFFSSRAWPPPRSWEMIAMCFRTSIPNRLVGIEIQIKNCWHTHGNNCNVRCAASMLTCAPKRNMESVALSVGLGSH